VIRVAHVGTGNVGSLALRHVIEDPRFELTGVCVSTPSKVGRDAGELAGTAATGILAVDSLDAVLAGRPDCLVYCAMGETRFFDALHDVQRVVEAGINLVGTSPTTLLYPWGVLPDEMIDPIDKAAVANGVSVFVNGVDPGFANDLVPFALAGTCRKVEQVRCLELADYATYNGATVMFDVMGFGYSEDEVPMLFKPGVLSAAWGVSLRELAAGFGVELDGITESYEREHATEAFDVAAGHIPVGGVEAVRFEITGTVDGRPAFVVEHVTRLRPDVRPDWAQPAQAGGSYRVEIIGEPSYTIDVCPTSREGDHNYAAILAGAGRVVNAIPAVVAAEPGIRTTLDLPLIRGGMFTQELSHGTR